MVDVKVDLFDAIVVDDDMSRFRRSQGYDLCTCNKPDTS